jgi:L-malate glycosyltransferase
MNILLVSTGGHIGGEETFTRNLAVALMSRGYKVWVAPGGEVQMNDLIKRQISVADIDIKGRSIKGLYKGAKAIKNFVRENKINVVHCQAAGPAIMGGIMKKMNWTQGEKWIYHDHGINKMTYKWLPIFLNLLDLSIANSDYELIKLKSNRVKDSKIVRIHNGIDPKEYDFTEVEKNINRKEIRKEFGILEHEFVIGYIGRLSPEKGCDLFLPALNKVLAKELNVKLLIVGDGILRAAMQEEMKSGNLEEKIIFTGFRSDIPKILCCFDILILPSYMETFSLTTIQAMGAGIPVIASNVGGNPEQIIPHFNGFLFETGNYIDLSIKIIDMIKNENIKKMGENGKELVEKYLNASRMVDEIEFYYSNNN